VACWSTAHAGKLAPRSRWTACGATPAGSSTEGQAASGGHRPAPTIWTGTGRGCANWQPRT
jgi:hypothetical protein